MLNERQSTLLAISLAGAQPPPYRTYPDGTAVWVYAMTFGKGRLCIGSEGDCIGYDRGFCYASPALAFAAADEWDGNGDPVGWFKNLQTGQYDRERRPA